MKAIASRENPAYKEWKRLSTDSQACRKAARTLLEGVHLCAAYLQHVGAPVVCIVNESSLAHAEVKQIISSCEKHITDCIVLTDSLYRALSQVEQGIGIAFVIDIPQYQHDEKVGLIEASVLLDNVQDPGNVGSILRSAAAAGIQSIYCSSGTAFSWSQKVLRAGMGAHFLLKIIENVDLAALLQRSAIPVLATSPHAQLRLYDVDLRQPVVWLFGHEGHGVAATLLELATHQITIPQPGAVESLNVAASAAVCFFEQVRQRL